VEDEISEGVETLTKLGFREAGGLGEQRPEQLVHGLGQAADVQVDASIGQLLERPKQFSDSVGSPRLNMDLFSRQVMIAECRFLPGAAGAEVPEIVGEGAGQQATDGRAHVGGSPVASAAPFALGRERALRGGPARGIAVGGRGAGSKSDLAQALQQVVHQDQQELSLGVEVQVEAAYR